MARISLDPNSPNFLAIIPDASDRPAETLADNIARIASEIASLRNDLAVLTGAEAYISPSVNNVSRELLDSLCSYTYDKPDGGAWGMLHGVFITSRPAPDHDLTAENLPGEWAMTDTNGGHWFTRPASVVGEMYRTDRHIGPVESAAFRR